MLTIIAFIIMIASGINWLMIGLLQYDFIAGIFGYQGSIFSRIIYIIFGAACLFLFFKMIKGKGSIPVFTRRNKDDVEYNMHKMQLKSQAKQNVKAALEEKEHFGQAEEEKKTTSLFDEHFKQ